MSHLHFYFLNRCMFIIPQCIYVIFNVSIFFLLCFKLFILILFLIIAKNKSIYTVLSREGHQLRLSIDYTYCIDYFLRNRFLFVIKIFDYTFVIPILFIKNYILNVYLIKIYDFIVRDYSKFNYFYKK